MANVMLAIRSTTTDALTTVSATTGMITHGAQSLGYLTESASLRAKAYRDATAAEIAENAGVRQILRVNSAKEEVAHQLLELQDRLDTNPRMKHIFENLDENMFIPTTSSLPANANHSQ